MSENTQSSERRGDLRGFREERLFAKIIKCPSDPILDGVAIGCETIDVSASGIRMVIERKIDLETELELWLDIRGIEGKFLLKGTVRWIEPDEDGFVCGLELEDHEDTADLRDWQELFN